MKNKWSAEEEENLISWLETKNIEELMLLLNRSEFSIRKKIDYMGLKLIVHKVSQKTSIYNYNWNEIQQYYNNDNFWNDVINKFNISERDLIKGVKNGLFKTRSRSEKMKLILKRKPRYLSDETKQKISEYRKKYLKDNPDKVPYLLNHYTNGASYPEKYFDDILSKYIKYEKYYQIGIYQLDIAIVNKKIGIEIDGDQHYLDKKIVESDKRKNKYLKDQNWDLIRIKWSDYKKLQKEEKEKYINDLVNYINGLINIKPEFEIKINFCKCGNKILKNSISCRKCSQLNQKRKIENRPNKEQLLLDIKEFGYCGTGRKYGVCDNTIRKWLKFKTL